MFQHILSTTRHDKLASVPQCHRRLVGLDRHIPLYAPFVQGRLVFPEEEPNILSGAYAEAVLRVGVRRDGMRREVHTLHNEITRARHTAGLTTGLGKTKKYNQTPPTSLKRCTNYLARDGKGKSI